MCDGYSAYASLEERHKAWAALPGEPSFTLAHCRAGDSREISGRWSEDPEAQFWGQSAWQWTNMYCDRAIMDTLSALVLHNLFGRYPNLRVISVEHGAEWFPYLVQRMDKMRGTGRNGRWVGGPLKERPSEICKRHVFVTAFPEDDVEHIVSLVGSEPICPGSDFPHAEECADPREFQQQIDMLSSADRRKILRDNGRRVVGAPL
jgi:predicted TIM-barrel fold metal-dependent hydrolase